MYSLHLWLGIPGERRVWLEQCEGIALILKNLSLYFSSIKIFVDGLTAYDGERIEVKENLAAFEEICLSVYKTFSNEDPKFQFLKQENHTFQILSEKKDIKLKSLSGYDYRTKICYCSMCDIAISDVSTTALVPFEFCQKPGVAFASCLLHLNASHYDIQHWYKIESEYLIQTNIKGVFFYDFHISPQHLYNLAAQVLEELSLKGKLQAFKDKPLKMHRLKVPPVKLYAKKYELEKKYNVNFTLEQVALHLDTQESFINDFSQIKNLFPTQNVQTPPNKPSGAVARVKNHLAYKFGQSLIINSKSILGWIRMFYVLSYIKEQHTREQKAYEESIKNNPSLKLPPIETLSDYNEALQIKEYLSYKLGEAFIKAYKNLWRGGLIKFYFVDSKRIVKEFKAKSD